MRVVIDTSACQGFGMCEALAPDFFALDEDGHVVARDGTAVSSELLEQVEEAVESCPASALRLEGAPTDT